MAENTNTEQPRGRLDRLFTSVEVGAAVVICAVLLFWSEKVREIVSATIHSPFEASFIFIDQKKGPGPENKF